MNIAETQTAFEVNVSSEVSNLQRVIVHTPGEEMALVSPDNRHQLLFDDILFADRACDEHQTMCEIFRKVVGSEDSVLQVSDLLRETFELADAREFFVDQLIRVAPERNFQVLASELKHLPPDELQRFALTGRSPIPINALPLPNLMFTRDLCAVVGSHIIVSHAATAARSRESVLIETVLKHHPGFAARRSDVITLPKNATFEGGDLLVVSDEIVLIGHSERTSFSGIVAIAQILFERTGIRHVVMVDLPKQRSSMHLDTVFTLCSEDECTYFPPIIEGDLHNVVHVTPANGGEGFSAQVARDLKSVLRELLGRDLVYIPCGGDDPLNQKREQWTDGANLFALAPGLVVGYERNRFTYEALRNHGYRVVSADGFLSYYEESEFKPGEKVAIKLEGNELSRGRGGPRCMTMPIQRA